MKAHYFSNKDLCNLFGRDKVGNGAKMGIFCQPINYHKDRINALDPWKSRNKIHGNIFPNLLRNQEGLQQTCRRKSFVLGALASLTMSDIVTNRFLHPRPKHIGREPFVSTEESEMSSHNGIMKLM